MKTIAAIKDFKDTLTLMAPSLEPWKPTRDRSRQVALLMSGGVDSSVTAALLKEQGWDVLGITMKIPTCSSGQNSCCGADAAFVCHQLGISHYFVDVCRAFTELIIKPFSRAYQQGLTPNPCADCNSYLKFSLLWDFVAEHFGVQYLASGHYARVNPAKQTLSQAEDTSKDQSYFLYGIEKSRLSRLMLPLADQPKTRTRALAQQMDLPVKDKPESMELCFAGQGDYRAVLADTAGRPGPVVDTAGNHLGTHKGLSNYTLGQRRGIGIAASEPLYVAKINIDSNTLVLANRDQVHTRDVLAVDLNCFLPELLAPGRALLAKIRSYTPARPCTIVNYQNDRIGVRFQTPVFAPCPGQKLVLYDNDMNVVAGGVMTH